MFSSPVYFKLRHSKPIYIGIERKLYVENKKIFDSIMKAFTIEKSCNCKCLYLFANDSNFDKYESAFNCSSGKSWVYQCVAAIEDYVIHSLCVTALHAASVIYQKNTLIFLGERLSGKSTLTHHMITENNCILLDDDIVFWDSQDIMGLGMPLRMRSKPAVGSVVCEFFDEKNKMRYLTDVGRWSMHATKAVYAFFLNYNNFENNVCLAKGNLLFESLLKSVRFSTNNMIAFKDVCSVMRDIPIYNLKYRDSKTACDLINQILKI